MVSASGTDFTPCSDWMPLIFTRRFGVVMSSFMRESRSLPPARISTSPQFLPSSAETWSVVCGLAYSNGRIVASFQRSQYAVGRDRQEGNAHADGIGHGVADSSHWSDRGWFAQADRAALVVAFAGHHVYHQLTDIADARQTVEIHVGIEHEAGIRIHDLFFVKRGGDPHDQGAINLALGCFHADNEPAILHADHLVHFHDAGFYIHRDVSHHGAADAAG